MTAATVFQNWSQVLEADPGLLKEIAGRYVIELGGKGEKWVLECSEKGSIGKAGGGTARGEVCSVSVDEEIFAGIGEGAVNPQIAFLDGQLKLRGNQRLALLFSVVVQKLREHSKQVS